MGNDQSQNPNSKSMLNDQTPMTNRAMVRLDIGAWDLIWHWDLEIGHSANKASL
jgi:hypothetical protein